MPERENVFLIFMFYTVHFLNFLPVRILVNSSSIIFTLVYIQQYGAIQQVCTWDKNLLYYMIVAQTIFVAIQQRIEAEYLKHMEAEFLKHTENGNEAGDADNGNSNTGLAFLVVMCSLAIIIWFGYGIGNILTDEICLQETEARLSGLYYYIIVVQLSMNGLIVLICTIIPCLTALGV